MDFGIFDAINQVRSGNVAGIGALVMMLIRMYKGSGLPWPEKYAWSIHLASGLLSFVVSLFAGRYGFGADWGVAAYTAAGAAVTASGLHEATKSIGAAVREPSEKPSAWSRFLGLFIPAPKG